MIRVRPKTASDARPAADAPKARRCLKCRGDFDSEWAGQRVCPRCKKKAEWRSGVSHRSH